MGMQVRKTVLPLEAVELNNGQIQGVPTNPRQWTLDEVEKLAASLIETPELLEMRCPIVTPLGNKFVVLGGNLRIAAARYNGEQQIPCFVLEGASAQKMKEIVIKDNGSFGKWDFDSLANEWDSEPLTDWGVDVWNAGGQDMDEYTEEKNQGQTKEFKIEIYLPETQKDNKAVVVKLIAGLVKGYGGRVV